MSQGAALAIFIMIFALVSEALWIGLSRRKTQWHRAVVFFLCCDYFVLSAIKWYLGEGSSTLVESFWDSEHITYLHYGLPLGVFCVAFPCILIKWKQLPDSRLIDWFSGLILPGMFLTVFTTGHISNAVYCILFVLCAGIALLISVIYKKQLEYFQRKAYLRAFMSALPFWSAWVLMHGIFLPNELYLGNLDEFTGAYGPFFMILLAGAVFVILSGIAAEIFLLPKGAAQYINLFLTGITLMGYVQNMFLNGKMEILDGDEQAWPFWQQGINLFIWVLVLGMLLLLGRKKDMFRKAGKGFCIYIILIQTVTLGYLFITADLDEDHQAHALTTKNALELAEGQNVLVFVLDRFDSSWMEELYAQDAEFLAPLKDFTFYPNATSQFANTGPGIPFLLTGTQWKESYGTDYRRFAYQDSQLLTEMVQQQFHLGIYTNADLVSDALYDDIANYSDTVKKSYRLTETVSTMWKSSMYKTVPFILKPNFTYYTDAIQRMVEATGVWDTENDMPFYELLKTQGLTLTDAYANAFRFYHMHGAHEPYTFSEDMHYDRTGRGSSLFSQIRGSMKIVYEYMEQLKALGKYEGATIIITADHGQQTDFVASEGKPQKVSLPVILIKEPGVSQETMQVNNAPVSHSEMMASMAKNMGMDSRAYGIPLDEVTENTERERIFLKLYPEFVKYTIRGDARDINNWSGELLRE